MFSKGADKVKEKITVMFPGSGSQYKGMMKKLYDTEKCVKDLFDRADELLGFDLTKNITEGSIIKLNKIENMLPGIFVSNVAMYQLFEKETGLVPDYFMGHSLGEYAALAAAHILPFEEALKVVWLRSCIAKEIREKTDGGMTILKGIETDRVDQICEKFRIEEGSSVSVGCYNTRNQVSIVGRDEERQKIEKLIRNCYPDAQIINLIDSAPYHSILMKEKAEELKTMLEQCHFGFVSDKVVSNISAKPYQNVEEIINGLTRQLYQPVQWEKSLQYTSEQGTAVWVEIGPLNVLKNIFLDSGIAGDVYSYDELIDRDRVKELKKDDKTEAHDYQQVLTYCLMHARSLRNYQKVPTAQMEQAKKLYLDVNQIRQQSVEHKTMVGKEQAVMALAMLNTMFEVKDTPAQERWERLTQIGTVTGETELCVEWIKKV